MERVLIDKEDSQVTIKTLKLLKENTNPFYRDLLDSIIESILRRTKSDGEG